MILKDKFVVRIKSSNFDVSTYVKRSTGESSVDREKRSTEEMVNEKTAEQTFNEEKRTSNQFDREDCQRTLRRQHRAILLG